MNALPVSHIKWPHRVLIGSLLGLGLSCLLALLPILPGAAVPVSSVPNPQTLNGSWVSDTADMLSPESEEQLNQLISELEATTGAELAIVTVPNTQPSASPKTFATELFNTWGIGKAGEDNGVLFLVSKGDRRTEIEIGYGLEAILPDAKVGEILSARVTPEFKQGNFGVGILNGTEAIVTVLNGDTLTPLVTTPNQGQRKPTQTPPTSPIEAFGSFASLLMVLGIGVHSFRRSSNGGRSSRSNSTYHHHTYGGSSSGSSGSDFGGGSSSGGGGGGDSW